MHRKTQLSLNTAAGLRKKDESGFAIVLVIGILTVLLMMGLTMVSVMLVEEQAADDFSIKLGSRYFSKSGFDHAINALKKDVEEYTQSPLYDVIGSASGNDDCWYTAFSDSTPSTTPAYLSTRVAPEKYEEEYSRWLYVKRDQTGFIVLDDYNFAQPRTGVLNQPRYGTTGSTSTGKYEIIGRYAILVKDEAGKVNVNIAGDYTGTRGESPYELRLNSVLENAHSATNAARQVDSTVADDLTEDIVNWRFGANDTSTATAPGVKNYDDDGNNQWFENDGIDNNADGSVDEEKEGRDEPGETNPDLPLPDPTSNTNRDKPIDSIFDLLLIPSFTDVSIVRNGTIPTTSQALMNAVSAYLSANSRDYNQFACIDAAGNIAWHNKISLNAALNAQKIYDEIDTSNYLQHSASTALYNELRRTCANIADAFDYDIFPSHIRDAAGTAYYHGVESVRINEIGKFSGYVQKGNCASFTSPSGNWVANGDMIQCPNTALETASYTYSGMPAGSNTYAVYFKTGPANMGLKIVLEPGTGNETVLQEDSPNTFIGTFQTVSADGLLNIEITNTDTTGTQATAELQYTILMARYIELINMSKRDIYIAGWRFSMDGGSTYYYVPTNSQNYIPAADYDETSCPTDVRRYGYLVIGTNTNAFEAVWDTNANGDLDEYKEVCKMLGSNHRTTIMFNHQLEDASGSFIPVHEDWGIVPGSNPMGTSSHGNIIVQAPRVNSPTPGNDSDYATVAWINMTSDTTNNKMGWLADSGLSTLEYEEYSRECVSAVSDESPWRISTNTRFAGIVNGEVKGSPGIMNDNTATVSLIGVGGSDLLWMVPSAPVGNLGPLGNVTLSAQVNATLLYNNGWSFDLTPFFTVDQYMFDSEHMTQTGGWTNVTPNGGTSKPFIDPYHTTWIRGDTQNLLTWQVENAAGIYTFIPPSGAYSLFIAGNYETNPVFEIDGASRTLNTSNLYSVTTDTIYFSTDNTTACGPSEVMDMTDRIFSFEIDATSDFDFDYAILAPTKYTYGKININTATKTALQALSFALSSSDMDQIILDSNKPYLSPGDVVRVLTGTDAQVRDKWTRISRFLTARSDVYEIIVVGQTINDQTPGDDFDSANDKISASDRLIGVVDRGEYRKDPSLGKVKVLHLHTE